MNLSWKWVLFSLFVYSISATDSETIKVSDEAALKVAIENNPDLYKKLQGKPSIETTLTDLLKTSEPTHANEKANVDLKETFSESDGNDKYDSSLANSITNESSEQAGQAKDEKKRIRIRRYLKKKEQSRGVEAVPKVQDVTSNQDKEYLQKIMSQKITYQLQITEPSQDFTLEANTTSSVSVNLAAAKSYKQSTQQTVEIEVSFSCASGVYIVRTILGETTDYLVDPNINGNCTATAIAPFNPEYLPSPPVSGIINTPIYLIGFSDAQYYSGEMINFFARPSNDAILKLNITIACRLYQKTMEIFTTAKTYEFEFTPLLIGNCTVESNTTIPFYQNFSPFEIDISPAIVFVTPAANTTYQVGADINVNLRATDLNRNLNVTVELYCENQFVKSLTQNIRSTYIFTQDDQVHGNCVLSLADVSGYYTEHTVPITVAQVLSFVSPKDNELIGPGTFYDLQVDGNAPDGYVSVLVTGRCTVGGEFFETVSLGIKKTVLMGPSFLGFCTLTASADNFASSVVPILVFAPLTPEEIAKEALRLKLDGPIVKITENF